MRSLDDLDVHGKRVLVRVDFNVPLAAGTDGEPEAGGVPLVSDDTRIAAALATIEELRAGGARLVLVSHLGRPEGKRVAELSLAPVADRLRELTGAKVTLAPAVLGDEVTALAEELEEGDILVLENVRFEPGETSNDPEFARALAALADLYVDDAFGVAHRAHASTEGITHLLPSAAGRLLEREVKTLTGILEHPRHPLVAIVGGAKVADKIAVIERFLEVADVVMIGGAMCFPFLCAQGHAVGKSLCDDEDVEHARSALQRASDTHTPQPGRARLLVPERPRHRRAPGGGRGPPRAGRGGGAGGLDGTGHRPQDGGALRERDRERGDRVLERPDGRVRAGAVRGGHPCGGGGRGERAGFDGRGRRGLGGGAGAVRAGGRRSTTCPQVAARRSSSSRAASCPA